MDQDIWVYEAERVLYAGNYATRFATIRDAQKFVDHVLASKAFSSRWPSAARRPIVVRASQRYEWAGANIQDRKIHCPFWALNDIALIHELSHFCQGREKQDHGPIFCGANKFLIGHFVDRDLGKRLGYAYRAYEVPYTKF
jgi:putative metallohydrolase (TIGR04338 family)